MEELQVVIDFEFGFSLNIFLFACIIFFIFFLNYILSSLCDTFVLGSIDQFRNNLRIAEFGREI